MSITNTPKLDLLRIQEDWQFADDAFNQFIDDADNKLVGIAHLSSPEHWSKWEPNKSYAYGDVVRITNTKSHQYYQCIQGGNSGNVEPQNNVTGSVIINDGSVEWIVKSLSDESSNGAIKIWLSGENYIRGDVVLYGLAIYRCKIKHTATNWGNDNDNWQEIFSSIREWKPGIFYFGGDTVLYDNKIWYCLLEHISDLTWSVIEKQNWRLVNGLALNDWETSHDYKLGDLIIENNIIYRCTQDHTSDSTAFSNDRATYWKLFHTPTASIKDWQTNEYYEVNQCILHEHRIYRCKVAHLSTSFSVNKDNWEIEYSNLKDWETSYDYHVNETVIYNKRLYRCLLDHTSTSFINDIINWVPLLSSGIEPWESNKSYSIGDIVYEDNIIYRCVVAHTSSNTFTPDRLNWELFHVPNAMIRNWQANEYYEINQCVLYGGNVFRCITSHTSASSFELDHTNWGIVYASINTWETGIYYKVGSCVISHGNVYRCNTAHLSNDFDDTTENTYWDLISTGKSAIAEWEPSTSYKIGELLVYDGVMYKVTTDFISGAMFSPANMSPILGEPMTNSAIDNLWL